MRSLFRVTSHSPPLSEEEQFEVLKRSVEGNNIAPHLKPAFRFVMAQLHREIGNETLLRALWSEDQGAMADLKAPLLLLTHTLLVNPARKYFVGEKLPSTVSRQESCNNQKGFPERKAKSALPPSQVKKKTVAITV